MWRGYATRARPSRFARYRRRSAALISSSTAVPSVGNSAIPALKVAEDNYSYIVIDPTVEQTREPQARAHVALRNALEGVANARDSSTERFAAFSDDDDARKQPTRKRVKDKVTVPTTSNKKNSTATTKQSPQQQTTRKGTPIIPSIVIE